MEIKPFIRNIPYKEFVVNLHQKRASAVMTKQYFCPVKMKETDNILVQKGEELWKSELELLCST